MGKDVNLTVVFGLFVVFALIMLSYGAIVGLAVLIFRWVVSHPPSLHVTVLAGCAANVGLIWLAYDAGKEDGRAG